MVDGPGDRAASVWTRIAGHSNGTAVTMAHLCAAALEAVNADGAAVTLAGPSARDLIYASGHAAAEIEEWQVTCGEGPGVDALEAGGPVFAVDLLRPAFEVRWPVFTPAALRSGANAIFALPLQAGAIRLGVLCLYRAKAGNLDAEQLADALGFADAALALLLDGAEAGRLEADHRQAHVHQATGMVLAQLGVSAEVAFVRLRAYAFAHDRRLGDVARDVVSRRLRFEPDPPKEADGDWTL